MIPFDITICGIEELDGHRAAGISHVLSILDPGYPIPPAFGAFGEHERLELRFHDVIEETPDMIAPKAAEISQLLSFGRDLTSDRRPHLLVHCHMGISRSTASMSLILAQALPERSGSEILTEILRIRDKAWPNLRMIEMGDAQLDRGGSLIEAARDIYRIQLERRPELGESFTNAGRGREIRAAAAR